MADRNNDVVKILSNILNENYFHCVEQHDRIALIKYTKNSKRVFSLVEKEKNFAQLENQISKLDLGSSHVEESKLARALKDAISEFRMVNSETKQASRKARKNMNFSKSQDGTASHKRYIVCFTNSFHEHYGDISFAEVEVALAKAEITVILVCYDMPIHEQNAAGNFIERLREKSELE
jgi:hypothetical protein